MTANSVYPPYLCSPANKTDAVDLLEADHVEVHKMFMAYRKLCSQNACIEEKGELARQICLELTIHAQIEEEIFYPELREAVHGEELFDQAEVEHGMAKDLIAQITGTSPDDDLFDARVTVLGHYIEHHVRQEREAIFVKARQSRVNLVAMGAELSERKLQLMDEYRAEPA